MGKFCPNKLQIQKTKIMLQLNLDTPMIMYSK